MERRAASHTEEEELNQRRRLLNLARKGDPKAISKLFELYQVRVYSGESLGKSGWPPVQLTLHKMPATTTVRKRVAGRKRVTKRVVRRAANSARRTASSRRTVARRTSRRKVSHR